MGRVAVGVLGGTFDPVHIGHLVLADQGLAQLGLREVLFVPAANPWRKGEREMAAVEHRVEMVRLAIRGRQEFRLSLVEVERPGPSHTADTLEELHTALGPEVDLYFLLGQDALADLPYWHEPERIPRVARLAVALRPGWDQFDLAQAAGLVAGLEGRIVTVEMPLLDLSSTVLRGLASQGRPLRYLVPDAVEAYLREHRLYR